MRDTQQVTIPPVPLVGDGIPVACADGTKRPYLSLDAAASTSALGTVLTRVEEFLPWYSSVHRGAGYKSQVATGAYEEARSAALAFAGRPTRRRTTTWRSSAATPPRPSTTWPTGSGWPAMTSWSPPWSSTTPTCCPGPGCATCRYVECGPDGTFGADDV